MRSRTVALVGFVGLGVAGSMAVHCADPTQIRVTVYTNLPCAKTPFDVQFAGAATLAELTNGASNSSAVGCDDSGRIGSVVLQPSGEKNGVVTFAVAGRERDALKCLESPLPPGCVVARRQLHFSPHDTIDVRVDLRASCIDKECPGGTCANGVCRAAECADGNACAEFLGDEPDAGPSPIEAGPTPTDAGPDVNVKLPFQGGVSGYQTGAPWLTRGGWPSRIGRSPYVATHASPPKERWKVKLDQYNLDSQVTIDARGQLYVGSNFHLLYAVNGADGGSLWQADMGGNVNLTQAIIGKNGWVYCGGFSGAGLSFWNAVLSEDGGRVWQRPTDPDLGTGTLALSLDGTTGFGVDNGTLWAFDPQDGGQLWTAGTLLHQEYSLGASGKLYFGTPTGVVSIDPATRTVTTVVTTTAGVGVPVLDGPPGGMEQYIYFLAGNTLHAYDLAAKGDKWPPVTLVGGNPQEPAIGPDGSVYVLTGQADGAYIEAFKPDGTAKWSKKNADAANLHYPPALDADGFIFSGGGYGVFTAQDPSDGHIVWSYNLDSPANGFNAGPAIGEDGTVYFADAAGFLYAIGPR